MRAGILHDVYVGNKGASHLVEVLEQWQIGKPLILASQKAWDMIPFTQVLSNSKIRKQHYRLYSSFTYPLNNAEIESALQFYMERDFDSIICLGREGAIDLGKMIRYYLFDADEDEIYLFESFLHPDAEDDVLTRRIMKFRQDRDSRPKIIAVSSGFGSGASVSTRAYYLRGRKTCEIQDDRLLPDLACFDPFFSMMQSPSQVAGEGFDAIAHAIEGVWSAKADDDARSESLHSLELLIKALPEAVSGSTEALVSLAGSSIAAARSLDMSGLTGPHALAFYLTSLFKVPHGMGLAVLLPAFIEYNYAVGDDDCQHPRGALWVRSSILEICKAVGEQTPREASERLGIMRGQFGLPGTLHDLGVSTRDDIHRLVDGGFNPRQARNNPRKLQSEALKTMLYALR
jgi:alcohol dehydrogenase class IV